MSLRDDLAVRLRERESRGLLRRLRALADVGPVVRDGARSFLNFSSNDYLGFASDPALRSRLDEVSVIGASASRLIVGHLEEHDRTEEALAAFVGLPSALLFSSGYAANVGAIPALVGPGDLVLSDAWNHASLIDGCRLSRARIEVYPHANAEALEGLLRAHRGSARHALVVTDAIFSMDGDHAPLRELAEVARRHDAWLYVDEAHSVGVCGPSGAGLCADLGVEPDVLLGTLGKAFGVAGAFVAGAPELREWLVNVARSFVFSTGFPVALLPVIRAAVEAVSAADERRAQLTSHALRLRAALRELDFEVPGEAAIVPVVLGSNERALAVAAVLRDRGILGLAIRPPTVPPGTARLRLTPMATHTPAQVEAVIEALRSLR
ncbi:MAG: 8-amino-7-oxononanoate synthase [Myxococcota bacterium]|nr:8-amino-7-oxononanoate synthase [Myxococcota bacterium]